MNNISNSSPVGQQINGDIQTLVLLAQLEHMQPRFATARVPQSKYEPMLRRGYCGDPPMKNPCYSEQPLEEVMQPLVDAGYVDCCERKKHGVSIQRSYQLTKQGEAELKTLSEKYSQIYRTIQNSGNRTAPKARNATPEDDEALRKLLTERAEEGYGYGLKIFEQEQQRRAANRSNGNGTEK